MNTYESTPRKPLRLWPGVAAGVLLVVIRLVVPLVYPEAGLVSVLGALVAGLLIVVWWMFFSRAAWPERLGALILMIIAVGVTRLFLHPSVTGAGQGMLFYIYAIQTVTLALVVWAVATRRLPDSIRRASMVAALLFGAGLWALLRTEGVSGGVIGSDLRWRWSSTAEERLLAQGREETPAPADAPEETAVPEKPGATSEKPVPAAPAAAAAAPVTPKAAPADPVDVRPAEWPGFRGPKRDGVIRGVQIDGDWSDTPPVELWRRPIGPGWSSFSVRGDLFYTQEQRGNDEIVACYRVSTGKPVWRHRDPVRFYESNGGAGPRGTPTLHGDRVYTVGATGIVNALDARTGAVVWSRNLATDSAKKVPMWGFTSSPLVVDDVVIVAAAGKLVGYEIATGTPRWTGPNGGAGFSSPQLVSIGGTPQVVLLSGSSAMGLRPSDGKQLWENAWPGGTPMVQPAVTADGDIITTTADAMAGLGVRRVSVRNDGGWKAEERWTSRGLKPYFNDYVLHNDHIYGFDGRILSCVDLKDGERKWKGGRFGNGQMLLLADQDLLLVLSDEGELALVKAAPDQFTELARFKAIEGKTWNHPVIVRDVLLVRNGEEMAAFRLPLAKR